MQAENFKKHSQVEADAANIIPLHRDVVSYMNEDGEDRSIAAEDIDI